jgi:hypothetical protein
MVDSGVAARESVAVGRRMAVGERVTADIKVTARKDVVSARTRTAANARDAVGKYHCEQPCEALYMKLHWDLQDTANVGLFGQLYDDS